MKGKCFFGIIVGLFLFANNAFAFELWNGFTTEMSMEQVIAKARAELQVTRDPNRSNQAVIIFEDRLSSADPETNITRNTQFFTPPLDSRYQRLSVYSPLSSYAQISQGGTNMNNIQFYFFENKLYAVWIGWQTNDIAQITRNNFGRRTAEINEIVPPRSTAEWSMWQLQNRLIYLNGRRMYILDRGLIERWISKRLNEANESVRF